MEKFSITVKIAEREYKLTIDRKQEKRIRDAAEQVNSFIKQHAEIYEHKDRQDLLAMAALQYSTNTLLSDEQLNFQQNQLFEKLEDIDRVLSKKLSK
nr:cell division protein ZapA [Bacteroidota bacterium]